MSKVINLIKASINGCREFQPENKSRDFSMRLLHGEKVGPLSTTHASIHHSLQCFRCYSLIYFSISTREKEWGHEKKKDSYWEQEKAGEKYGSNISLGNNFCLII